MRVAVGQFAELTQEMLRYAAQLGVSGIQLKRPSVPGDSCWAYEDLLGLRLQCEEYGLRLEAIENVPKPFYDKVMLGLPGRDEQIENYQQLIRNVGKAGIPILGHNFRPHGLYRTSWETKGRGGAKVSSFDIHHVKDFESLPKFAPPIDFELDAETMWSHYAYFIKAVIPVAEEAGVKLALHPDDPPAEQIGGIARIFSNVDGFKRAAAIANSPAWGLNLCLGSCSSMAGGADNVREMIRYFGPRRQIFYVHFRDVQGSVPVFQECFLGEGNYDPSEMLLALRDVGFDGFLLDDHVPMMDNDTSYGHLARANAIGYIQGLLNMIKRVPNSFE
jgi:mannonate dehydratase